MCAPAHQSLRGILWQEVFYRLRLWEFLQVSIDEAVEQFRQLLQAGGKSTLSSDFKKPLTIVQDPQHRRFGNTVDMNSAFDIFTPHSMSRSDIQECLQAELAYHVPALELAGTPHFALPKLEVPRAGQKSAKPHSKQPPKNTEEF
ncbi:hypothetical protein NQZ68_040454 [Dissostichus eleginoides]|nr:hypothetical protein NQZ68_040454 [Dissostichus eleginoides]